MNSEEELGDLVPWRIIPKTNSSFGAAYER